MAFSLLSRRSDSHLLSCCLPSSREQRRDPAVVLPSCQPTLIPAQKTQSPRPRTMGPPGMLYVTMQPQPGLSPDQFHEWYNNEHGPTRLRLPHVFSNGLRYRAADSREPVFLAAYDVTDMSLLTTPTYTSLRANRSPREAETIGQVDVVRFFVDLVSCHAVAAVHAHRAADRRQGRRARAGAGRAHIERRRRRRGRGR